MAAFQSVRLAIADLWDDFFMALVCNVLWLLGMLLVLPGPPATLALFFYANRLAHGERADLADFWTGFRRYWKTAWLWALLNLAVIFFLASDYGLVGRGQTEAARFLQVLYAILLIGWIVVQLYTLPFLFEQEQPDLLRALRNGAVMLAQNPGFSLGFALFLALALSAGTLLFLLSAAFGAMLVALASNHAVIDRLGKN